MVLHLPIASLKTDSGRSQYRDANPVPTSFVTDDLTTTQLRLVYVNITKFHFISLQLLTSSQLDIKGKDTSFKNRQRYIQHIFYQGIFISTIGERYSYRYSPVDH